MYFLNYFHTCANVARLALNRIGTAPVTFSDLDTDYRKIVKSMRVIPPPEKSYRVSFEDEDLGLFIRSSGVFDEIFYDIQPIPHDEREHFRNLIVESMNLLKSIDSRLWFMVNLLVTDVVFLKSERVGGGSGSHLFGVVCVSPSDTWGASELLESIVHEATHLNLFVCDMVNSLFNVPVDRLSENDAKVVSAVRIGQLRPLDKALHSAVVAVPLMYIQHLQSKTELVDLFSDSLKVCTSGLLAKEKFYTPYGKLVVEQLATFATSQNFDRLSADIGNPKLAVFRNELERV